MKLFNYTMQPYMDAETDLGGGGSEIDTSSQQTDTQQIDTNQGGGERQATQTDFTPFLGALSEKLQYNHQPVKVESIDDVIANYQKGMNYEKAVEKAKQEARQAARDENIAEGNWEWKGKRITTEAEYKKAKEEADYEQSLIDQGVSDPDVVRKEAQRLKESDPDYIASREQAQKN